MLFHTNRNKITDKKYHWGAICLTLGFHSFCVIHVTLTWRTRSMLRFAVTLSLASTQKTFWVGRSISDMNRSKDNVSTIEWFSSLCTFDIELAIPSLLLAFFWSSGPPCSCLLSLKHNRRSLYLIYQFILSCAWTTSPSMIVRQCVRSERYFVFSR